MTYCVDAGLSLIKLGYFGLLLPSLVSHFITLSSSWVSHFFLSATLIFGSLVYDLTVSHHFIWANQLNLKIFLTDLLAYSKKCVEEKTKLAYTSLAIFVSHVYLWTYTLGSTWYSQHYLPTHPLGLLQDVWGTPPLLHGSLLEMYYDASNLSFLCIDLTKSILFHGTKMQRQLDFFFFSTMRCNAD